MCRGKLEWHDATTPPMPERRLDDDSLSSWLEKVEAALAEKVRARGEYEEHRVRSGLEPRAKEELLEFLEVALDGVLLKVKARELRLVLMELMRLRHDWKTAVEVASSVPEGGVN